jgi:hypothetical protein
MSDRGDFAVRTGLSRAELESVGLAILLHVSQSFERAQAWIPDRLSDSGFSAEDLVSNVIGYYRAVRAGLRRRLRPGIEAGGGKNLG